MFKNYLKSAWRNLIKNKAYSALNIFGLTIGITCASLILLWVEDELSFDENFAKKDQVYYLPTNQQYEGEWRTFYQSTPGPLAEVLKAEIPEIVGSARTKGEALLFEVGDNSLNKYGRFVDPDFIEMFSLTFLEGDPKTAFSEYDAIVISKETATHLYGEDTQVLGKVVRVDNNTNYIITGVFEDLPTNVTYGFEWVAPFERFVADKEWMTEYGNNFSDTFVELSPEADFASVDAKVRNMLPAITENKDVYAFLHPMKDWRLRSNFEGGKKVGGQIVYVRLFSFIALIILLIACINFMNLSTARSEKRAKEVGVRKVLGSGKKRLISQFIAEALLTAIMASLATIILLSILLPQFNILIEKQLELGFLESAHLISILAITLICGLLAGWYPAFYLSSFKPVEVIKGIRSKEGSATRIRKGLVIAQFTVSIVFIVSTIIVYQQVKHVKSRDLGFAKENLLKISVNGDIIKNFEPIKQDMIASGVVEHIGLNNSEVLAGGNNGSGLEWPGGTDTEDVLISFRYISSGFFDTAGMEIVKGRGFKDAIDYAKNNILVTEAFAKLIDKENPLGKTVRRGDENYTVVGVVKDYLYGDMYGESDPVMFFNYHGDARYLYARLKPETDLSITLATMEKVLEKHNPAFPFEYEFVDDAFNARFKSERLIGSLSQLFALLAIIISCLGLFGLAAYTAEQRQKEIGVRKVLGSTVVGIVQLLSKDFMRLVLVALFIAGPLAYWLMQNWLESFAYRISIDLWVFVFAGLVAICIALLTVSFQAFKAALANPAKSLRSE
ncbi:ABC transporter permease [Eudoraea chungangensis]|uniref:ABC transporter permease n=1 Tax=Eudoraea chungangensis TaxID=1481905 RepID=UPI0023EAFADB|nr:ABC transporter permease [Eudoraea chungangensis]